MIKWEYCHVYSEPEAQTKGEEGWEAYAATHIRDRWFIMMKRPIGAHLTIHNVNQIEEKP